MYGRRPYSHLSCRPESCTGHPCLGPAVGSLLGRHVSRGPAASPGACAQHVRLWQYGHARHERDRGMLLLLLLSIPLKAWPRPSVGPICPTPHLLLLCSKLCLLLLPFAHEQPETDLDRLCWLSVRRPCSCSCSRRLGVSGGRPLQPPPRLACLQTFAFHICKPLNVWLTQTPTSPADDRRPRYDGSPARLHVRHRHDHVHEPGPARRPRHRHVHHI